MSADNRLAAAAVAGQQKPEAGRAMHTICISIGRRRRRQSKWKTGPKLTADAGSILFAERDTTSGGQARADNENDKWCLFAAATATKSVSSRRARALQCCWGAGSRFTENVLRAADEAQNTVH